MNKSYVIQHVCNLISQEEIESSRKFLLKEYPFEFKTNSKRSYSLKQLLELFINDGFIDRYSGERLVFPGALKILTHIFPEEFPYHKNWKMDECHIAYWELVPTLDHITPIARGGEDVPDNWVCTSQLRNNAKSNFTIEELGWKILPPGDIEEWDGLLGWFISYVEQHMELRKDKYIDKWYNIACKVSYKY